MCTGLEREVVGGKENWGTGKLVKLEKLPILTLVSWKWLQYKKKPESVSSVFYP